MRAGFQEENGVLYKKPEPPKNTTKVVIFYILIVILAIIAFYLGVHSVSCVCPEASAPVDWVIANGTLVP